MRWRWEGDFSVLVDEDEEDDEEDEESEDSSLELSPEAWGQLLPWFEPAASVRSLEDVFLFLTASGSSFSSFVIANLAVSTTSNTSLRCLSCLATFL